jgi:hypothetical protein
MARAFNGTSGKLFVDSAPKTAVPITLACWFKPRIALTSTSLFSVTATANDTNEFRLFSNSSGAVTLRVRGGGTVDTTTTALAVDLDRSWHHVCGIGRTTTDRSVYLDGGNRIDNVTSQSPSGLARLAIGCRSGSTDSAFTAYALEDICVWDTDLTDGEVKLLASGLPPWIIRPGHLVFWAPLLPDATALRDYTAGARHLTDSGGNWPVAGRLVARRQSILARAPASAAALREMALLGVGT